MPIEMPVCSVEQTDDELIGRTHAMATDITIRVPRSRALSSKRLCEGVDSALEVFRDVESACTRFNPESPLMRANASPSDWHQVPNVLFEAVVEASRASCETGGWFDPRVYVDLLSLGYDRSLRFGGEITVSEEPAHVRMENRPWTPQFRFSPKEIHLGGVAIDLGGIGKGLAVRWASQRLADVTPDFLVEAGGDCQCRGTGPGGERWRIGVEDPIGPNGQTPLAVLELEDRACTTSSTKVRNWFVRGRPVHHLIDPSTGEPGGSGLASVTVVGLDAAMSEVWSKTLFLHGSDAIGGEAEKRGLAALWVTSDGALAMSTELLPYLIWRRG